MHLHITHLGAATAGTQHFFFGDDAKLHADYQQPQQQQEHEQQHEQQANPTPLLGIDGKLSESESENESRAVVGSAAYEEERKRTREHVINILNNQPRPHL